MNKLASPEQEKIQAKVLKLLWAIGGSTAGFVAQPGQHNYNTDNEESAELFRFRSRVLGIPAAAAMDAEEIAAYPRGVDQTQRLRRLATTDHNALVEAQRLISDTWNSMPGGGQRYCSDSCGEIDDLWEAMSIGVLAMVLLITVKPDGSGESLRKGQEETALSWVEAILNHYEETALSQQDASLPAESLYSSRRSGGSVSGHLPPHSLAAGAPGDLFRKLSPLQDGRQVRRDVYRPGSSVWSGVRSPSLLRSAGTDRN